MKPSQSFKIFRNVFHVLVPLTMLFSQFGWAVGSTSASVLICYVDADAVGSNVGTSWENAYTDLQSALGGSSCQEIWVATGTYKPSLPSGRGATFQLKNGVAIYGGFDGTETLRSERDPAVNVTLLSGDLADDDNGIVDINEPSRDDNSYHVVTGSSGAILDGFTITAGNANGGYCPGPSCGGGMLNNNSSPTLSNLTFSGNSASWGGGMENYDGSTPTVTNTTFSSNTAENNGGGMNNGYCSPVVTNVTFSGNNAGNGGGMANELSSPMVTNITFSGNNATNGGGIYNNKNSRPTIRNTILWGNSGDQVDGIYSGTDLSYPVLSDSVVQGGCPDNGVCTGDIIVADPELLALADNGGYTKTMALGAGSSAIDTGNDEVCAAAVGSPLYGAGGLDQRGVTRPQGGACDIGTYELLQYSISGNAGVSGAILSYADGTTKTATADGNGDYSLYVFPGESGTVTPSLAGYLFSPASRTYSNVQEDQMDQDYAANPPDYTDIIVYRGGAWLNFDFTSASLLGGVWTGMPVSSCIPAPIDYDGDGFKEYSQLCAGAWHFSNDDGSLNKGIWVGDVSGQVPVPGDYNADGTDEVVVWRNGAWLFYDFTTGSLTGGVWTGAPIYEGQAAVPAPMDYDGDGKLEFTTFSVGPWHFYNDDGSLNKGIWTGGVVGDKPVPGDYNGDGTDEVVVWRDGAWLFYDFSAGGMTGGVWTGAPIYNEVNAVPAPLDYDLDGSLEFTTFSVGPWHFYNNDGSLNKGIWTGGVAGDKPISRRYLP